MGCTYVREGWKERNCDELWPCLLLSLVNRRVCRCMPICGQQGTDWRRGHTLHTWWGVPTLSVVREEKHHHMPNGEREGRRRRAQFRSQGPNGSLEEEEEPISGMLLSLFLAQSTHSTLSSDVVVVVVVALPSPRNWARSCPEQSMSISTKQAPAAFCRSPSPFPATLSLSHTHIHSNFLQEGEEEEAGMAEKSFSRGESPPRIIPEDGFSTHSLSSSTPCQSRGLLLVCAEGDIAGLNGNWERLQCVGQKRKRDGIEGYYSGLERGKKKGNEWMDVAKGRERDGHSIVIKWHSAVTNGDKMGERERP